MQDVDDLSYEGEAIKLDKVRHIKYTIKGLKIIARKHGSVIKGFTDMQDMNPEFDIEGMDNLVLLLHAGLIHEDQKLTADDVENMVTMTNMALIMDKILKAFDGSTPKPKEEDGGSNDNLGEQLSTST